MMASFSSLMIIASSLFLSGSNGFQLPSARNLSADVPTSTSLLANNPKHPTPSLYHHHVAIRTRNIENAIKFYSLFGFKVETKFRAASARAAWLSNAMLANGNKNDEQSNDEVLKGQSYNIASRLEIIEIPQHVLNEKEGTIKRAIDLLQNEAILGLNHYALDVTPYIHHLAKDEYYGLDQFLLQINQESLKMFGKTLRVAMQPKQQVIGSQVFELAFVYDADGVVVELMRYIKELDQNVESGWEPWDGEGFEGTGPSASSTTETGKDTDDEFLKTASANAEDELENDDTANLLQEQIRKEVESEKVVIYSKSRCPFCARTKYLFETEFSDMKPVVYELDTIENGVETQSALKLMTGQRTVPSVWIKGSFVGGNDDTQRLFQSGVLKDMLNDE